MYYRTFINHFIYPISFMTSALHVMARLYLPVGLMGHTWFISCLFFMKLRPQKWQVPVLRVMPDPDEELEWELPVLLGKLNNVVTKN